MGGWGGFSLGRGLGLPRGNFGGARGEILARSPYWALAGVGGFVQARHSGQRSQEWAGLFVKPGLQGDPLPLGTCP